MATTSYLEHYLDSLESLPVELQRNFTLMRDLDSRAQNIMKEIDGLADEYLKLVASINSDDRKDRVDYVQKLFSKAREYGDDKVQLAMQTYEMVDKHIRRLDSDLARFEAELKDKTKNNQGSDKGSPTLKKRGREKKAEKKRGRGRPSINEEKPKKRQKKQAAIEEPVLPSSILPLSITHPSDVLDMPVDPNEPTYCLCHQVSYGEMIGCDNPDCPIEWFHFACVGLTTKPKGKWFCPKCTLERKKK
ncbi:Inhibitor of growth protein 5 [Nymphon striatum]|nr:Inhibitor of growth protein 5 [Nymphon striatum]